MARSSRSTDAVATMLRDLVEAEALAGTLAATAPRAIAAAGGAHALVAERGHPTGAWFWSISPVPDSLWEALADEHQTPHRSNPGDDQPI
jgi:hypothetical protein